MFRIRLPIALALAAALTSFTTGASDAIGGVVGPACPSVAIGSYGTGCANIFDVPDLSAGVDTTACTITFKLSGFTGCCNTFIANRILIIGVQPTNVPVPLPLGGPGCTLLAQPDLVLVFPGSAGAAFTAPIPAIDVTLFVQGVNHYFTTIGFSNDYNWSNGLKVDIG